MLFVKRWLVLEYVNRQWVTARSFPSKPEAANWLKTNGERGMRLKDVSVLR